MPWFFSHPESITPDLVETDDQLTTNDSDADDIVETVFDGCAWCGTGGGCCAEHMAAMFAQSAARKAAR